MKYHSSHGELTKTSFDQDFSGMGQYEEGYDHPVYDENPSQPAGQPRLSAEGYNWMMQFPDIDKQGFDASQKHYPSEGNPAEVGLTPEATNWLYNLWTKQTSRTPANGTLSPLYEGQRNARRSLMLLEKAMADYPANN